MKGCHGGGSRAPRCYATTARRSHARFSPGERRRGRGQTLMTRFVLLAMTVATVGCAGGSASSGASGDGASAGTALAYGAVRVIGWHGTVLDDTGANLDVRHRRTGEVVTISPDAAGQFATPLPPGPYAIAGVWAGRNRMRVSRDAIRFAVPSGLAVYLGTLEIRIPSDRSPGDGSVLDDFEAATRRLRSLRPRAGAETPAVKGLMFRSPGRGIVVSALLDDRLLVPFLVDTGATYTTITQSVARALGIGGVEHLPRHAFHSLGGVVELPVTVVPSVRVDEARATAVEVAIDVTDHLPVGLLGSSFLRHFRVTIDQELGDIQLDR